MNALVIVRRDAPTGHLSDDARTALGVMWTLQMKTGPHSGAWTWLNFNYEPWESPNSPYFGASLAALAVGSAPDTYSASPEIQENVKALRGYFNREHEKVALLNQLMGIWVASGRMRDLLTDQQRQSTIDATFALQQPDGGWSTSSLGSYKRVDTHRNDADGRLWHGPRDAGVAGGGRPRTSDACRFRFVSIELITMISGWYSLNKKTRN
jgi:squalene-hopene/tetraprenyl-beta-curcumene cyclase